MRYLLSLLTIVFSATLAMASLDDTNRKLMDSINVSIKNFDIRKAQREDMFDRLKHKRTSQPSSQERLRATEELSYSYIGRNNDSALMYMRLAHVEAQALHNDTAATRLWMQRLAILPLTGVIPEALESFNKIKPADLPQELKINYWRSAAQLYWNIQQSYPEGMYKNKYRQFTVAAIDSLMKFYPAGSLRFQLLAAHRYQLLGEHSLAAASYMELLPKIEHSPEQYADALLAVSNYYADRPNYKSTYLNLMLRQTLLRLNQGVAKPTLIAETGRLLYENGHRRLGEKLMGMAINMRPEFDDRHVPFDRVKYIDYLSDRTVRTRIWLTIGMLAAISFLIVAIVIANRRRKNLLKIEEENRLSTEHKDLEISDLKNVSKQVLSLALMSNEQLKEYNLYVLRKLKAGQVKDLFAEVESGRYIHSLGEKFFTTFDASFLDTFPNFVENLNALLTPERQLAVPSGMHLSPELRIAAFMRLGITDSAKLAQLLELSINTIYTYRNRLKGRAKNRETFEEDLKKIMG